MNRTLLPWTLPLAILAIAIGISPFVDMPIERLFYNSETHSFINNTYTDIIAGSCGKRQWLCDWGVFPAQAAGVSALIALMLSYLRKDWKPWRKPALMLVLTMAIGAGFITHTLLKDHWGRPRPKQVIEFGGKQEFRTPYQPNFTDQPEPSKSFPCGHCTMGFFFFAFMFLGKRLNNSLFFYGGLTLAITLGTALSITRMMQGGHFLSDTITSGVIMWLTALTCDWLIFGDED